MRDAPAPDLLVPEKPSRMVVSDGPEMHPAQAEALKAVLLAWPKKRSRPIQVSELAAAIPESIMENISMHGGGLTTFMRTFNTIFTLGRFEESGKLASADDEEMNKKPLSVRLTPDGANVVGKLRFKETAKKAQEKIQEGVSARLNNPGATPPPSAAATTPASSTSQQQAKQ